MVVTDFNGFKGAAQKIEDLDLPRIGHRIGVGEDELHAFIDVETNGRAFDDQGRPRILFEPHVFYRNLSGDARSRAVGEGLAAKKWGAIKYGRESAQYPRLQKAMAIDETAALKSASWGLTQILGENYRMVGYASPQDMVLDFMADEENHLEAAIEFIIAAGIDDEMQALAKLTRKTLPSDTVGIVRVYNGPGYKKNDYHTKFARRHNWWRGVPDTPWEPDEQDVNEDPILDPPEQSLTERERLQTDLKNLGYYDGKIDGIVGPKTKKAVRDFQTENGLDVDGIAGPKTRAVLDRKLVEAHVPAPVPVDDDVGVPVELPTDSERGSRGFIAFLIALFRFFFPKRG